MPLTKSTARVLAKDVAEAILGPFSVARPWSEPTPPSPEPVELVVIAAALAAAARQPVDSSHLKTALPLWEESWRLIYFEGLMKKRRAALVKLLFSEKETVPLNEFLLKLLPKDDPAKRHEYLEEALLRASTIFAERFQRGGNGWPQEEACRLLGTDQAKGAAVLKSFQTQVENLGGVTLDLAVTYAPLILGWREFKSSPRARGSQAQQSKAQRRVQAGDLLPEGTIREPSGEATGLLSENLEFSACDPISDWLARKPPRLDETSIRTGAS